MRFQRDFERFFEPHRALPVRIPIGPRQCGKTSLGQRLSRSGHPGPLLDLFLDDTQTRALADREPALALGPELRPTLIDEIQEAPGLLAELKLRIDRARRAGSTIPPIWVTGSNATQLDRAAKETLSGRANYFRLHTLSAAELQRAGIASRELFTRGGWPELYARPELDRVRYLDDHVRTFIEKDVAATAGIAKLREFRTFLGLLAARSGQLLNTSEIGQQAGIKGSTVQEWISLLAENGVVAFVQPYASNLNKRLVRTPKVFFVDVGVVTRLQGWRSLEPLLVSPQMGPLFETAVFAELVRCRDHRLLGIEIFLWRTRDGQELDFLVRLETSHRGPLWIPIEAKLGGHAALGAAIPPGLLKTVQPLEPMLLVTLDGERRPLPGGRFQVPLSLLADELTAIAASS
ncbi:MAG: ATP-binding protein [Planctomycetes bacterium]|nr:ATP-binding protein [Planctomycetota bacterium]